MEHDIQTHTILASLKACAMHKDLHRGSKIHADIVKMGLLQNNAFLASSLVSMYAKCGSLAKALELLNGLSYRDVVSWNALMAGYAQYGSANLVLKCFERMQLEGLSPNAITFVCILKACGHLGAANKGKEIHAEIVREGLVKSNIVVGTALLDMYAKCGLLAEAKDLFYELPARNLVSWNALIAGYVQHGHAAQALNCFELMRLEGICPDAVTFLCMLKACSSTRAVDKGKEMHAEIVRGGLLDNNIAVGNALVDMYAKCGLLAKAREVFDEFPIRNVVSWNTLMAGYALLGHNEQVLKCFEEMQLDRISPDAVTFVCMLKACGNMGAADKGKEIHVEILKQRLLNKNLIVGTALVDFYVKCGFLTKAQEAFDELPIQDVALWNTIMTGYTMLGKPELVFNSLDKMIREGIKPNLNTITIVLNACSHNGLLEKGQKYFKRIWAHSGIIPTLKHYSCMVDLFARAGYLDKAVAVIKEMPLSADIKMWLSVLGACQKWGNVKLGRMAFEHAVHIDEEEGAAYACMKNIYIAAGRQGDADKIEALRVKNQAHKNSGQQSWTDMRLQTFPKQCKFTLSSAKGVTSDFSQVCTGNLKMCLST